MSKRPLAYLAVKYHPDQANRAHIENLLAALEQAGYEPLCVVRDLEHWGQTTFDSPVLMRNTFRLMESCDVAVIDLAEKGVGVGIEAGYACARGQPVVAIAPLGSDISTTLQGIANAVYSYADYSALTTFFQKWRLPD
jgi:2'-deoxynucleoside 5'-phosphate N-hydrolase